MSACPKVDSIGDVESELHRLRHLLSILYASLTGDRALDDVKDGLLWMISDLESETERIIAGIHKIEEAGT